jgi:hypothetical protein
MPRLDKKEFYLKKLKNLNRVSNWHQKFMLKIWVDHRAGFGGWADGWMDG